MNVEQFYKEMIIEHSNSKKNKFNLENATKKEFGINPSCGDEVEIQIEIKDDKINNISFQGQGCAISQASASILCDLMKNKTLDDCKDIINSFLNMIKKEDLSELEEDNLEDAIIFKSISNMPARVKCTTLSWHALKKIVE